MVGVKPDANKSSTRKTREFWGKNWLGAPVEAPEDIGEREKERTVQEYALFVNRGIDEGLHLQTQVLHNRTAIITIICQARVIKL